MSQKRKKEIFGQRPGYLPLETHSGEAQADFGDAEYYENGRLCSGKYLNLSFPYSNKGYFQVSKGRKPGMSVRRAYRNLRTYWRRAAENLVR